MRSLVLATVLTMLAPAVHAQNTKSVPAAAPTSKPERKQCRAIEPATGSHMAQKHICHTRSEWTQIERDNAANAGSFANTVQHGSPANP